MSQVSYGTITINDLTDITDVFLQYGLAISSATVTNNYAFNGLGERGWFIAATGAVDTNTIYFEYDNVNQVYKIVTNPSSTSGLYISAPYPTWSSGYQIWIRRVTIKEGIDIPEYGTPYLDTAVSQIQNNYIGLDNRLKAFFWPGDSNYPGAYSVAKTTDTGLVMTDISTYGFNTRVATAAISMGYNEISLLEMGLLGNNFNGIKLYSPILTNNVITGNRLDATLTSEGLKLLKGGIEAGTSNQSGFIYLSTEPYGTYSINGSTGISDWKEIIGTNFGVREDGTLYANNAVISGQIIVDSGSNVYNIDEIDDALSLAYEKYLITQDTLAQPNKSYYQRLYIYEKTKDTSIESDKIYYTQSGSGTDEDPYVYTEVESPVVADIENYYEYIATNSYSVYDVSEGGDPHELGLYELSEVEEAVTNYITSHITLGADGLGITADEGGYKILISSDGIRLYASEEIISTFSENIEFSSSLSQRIGGENEYIEFDHTTGRLNIVADSVSIGSRDASTAFESIENTLTPMQDQLDNQDETLKNQQSTLNNLTGYVDINTEDSYIRVGKRDADSYVQIDGADTKVAININGKDVAYMNGNRFYAPSAVVTNLYMKTEDNTIGTIGWVMRSNGHLSLKRLR